MLLYIKYKKIELKTKKKTWVQYTAKRILQTF